jgi:hypothetical protein
MRSILNTIIVILLSLSLYTNVQAVEIVDKSNETLKKITSGGKNIFKKLSRSSLKEDEILKFLTEYVIFIDDDRGEGLVVYYFEDEIYKRYKNLELVSQDIWKISKIDRQLKIYNGKNKNTWKIQPGKKNRINVKKKGKLTGKLYEFSYKSKTDFHVSVEEKKLNN